MALVFAAEGRRLFMGALGWVWFLLFFLPPGFGEEGLRKGFGCRWFAAARKKMVIMVVCRSYCPGVNVGLLNICISTSGW